MKKFGKVLFGTISIATLAAGAYYLYKNVLNKDTSDDFDDFDDEMEFGDDDQKEDTREYVSIHIAPEQTSDASTEDSKQEEDQKEQDDAESSEPKEDEAKASEDTDATDAE